MFSRARTSVASHSLVILVLLVSIAASAQAALRDELISYWPLDGDGADVSGNDRPLDLVGAPEFSDGLLGEALHLHGDVSQYAIRPEVDDAFNFGASDFSIQVWVNFESDSGEHTIIEQWEGSDGPGWTITSFSGSSMRFDSDHQATQFNAELKGAQLGSWGALVVEREGSHFKTFYNGVKISDVISTATIQPSPLPLLVGRRNDHDGRGFPFVGLLDEVAIWGRALSDEEIVRLYGSGHGLSLKGGTLPGDANDDGKVDLADFGILKANFGSGATLAEGDFDGNGQVDLADFGILKANFGTVGGTAVVPEPSGLATLATGGILVGLGLLVHGAKRKWGFGGSDWPCRAMVQCQPLAGARLPLAFRREIASMLQVGAAAGLVLVMVYLRASSAAEPLFWFDATDASTVLDGAGQSAKGVTNPFPVATWKDLGSNGIDAVQLEDGYRPRFVPDGINGLPSLKYDGVDDFFSLLPALAFHDQMSVFTVVQLDSIDPKRREGILSGSGWQGAEVWLGGDDGPLLGQIYESRIFPRTFDDFARAPMVFGVTYDGAQATFSLNGKTESRPYGLLNGEWAQNQYVVGRSPFASATLHGMMSELVVYDAALDETERAQVESRLLRKYGLAPPQAGDANADGKVDLADFGILKANFGSGGTLAEGDFDGNGQVDLADFGILKANFGTAGGAAAVPEPGGLALALGATLGLIAVAAHQRRGGAARWVG